MKRNHNIVHYNDTLSESLPVGTYEFFLHEKLELPDIFQDKCSVQNELILRRF